SHFVDVLLHLDVHLNEWAGMFGPTLYPILFLIIFCETGLVVTPILPGDSLLFALGAMAATENSVLELHWLCISLVIAAILGNTVNYAIGKRVGPHVFTAKTGRWLNREYLMRTHNFYEKHGGKTIILTRFMPIVRTFAPFVAGIGNMDYRRF